MTYIISPERLREKMNREEIVVIDVRSNLQQPDLGEQAYTKSHIQGAYYLHLANDLSGEVTEHGGNHPLPCMKSFANTLAGFGINEHTKVVIYDEANDMYAPRAWWLLRQLGVNQSFVLDGGFAAWIRKGYEVTDKIPTQKQTVFHAKTNAFETVTMKEVKSRDKSRTVLIDSRAFERYIGEIEPMYEKAGHIPGAKNYFWQDVLDESGSWKSVPQLQDHFAHLKEADEIIVSCGSGISACPNILALKLAGFENVKLYPGSFSDWISYPENRVETGENKDG